jgi:hypothetical protein
MTSRTSRTESRPRKNFLTRCYFKEMRREHFETRGTKLIEKQHRGEEVSHTQPEPNLVFEERRRLVTLLFKNRDKVPEEELQADRTEAAHVPRAGNWKFVCCSIFSVTPTGD